MVWMRQPLYGNSVPHKSNRPNVSLHGPDAEALIWKLRAAEVQLFGMLGQHSPGAA
jgi:hypothetical protein